MRPRNGILVTGTVTAICLWLFATSAHAEKPVQFVCKDLKGMALVHKSPKPADWKQAGDGFKGSEYRFSISETKSSLVVPNSRTGKLDVVTLVPIVMRSEQLSFAANESGAPVLITLHIGFLDKFKVALMTYSRHRYSRIRKGAVTDSFFALCHLSS